MIVPLVNLSKFLPCLTQMKLKKTLSFVVLLKIKCFKIILNAYIVYMYNPSYAPTACGLQLVYLRIRFRICSTSVKQSPWIFQHKITISSPAQLRTSIPNFWCTVYAPPPPPPRSTYKCFWWTCIVYRDLKFMQAFVWCFNTAKSVLIKSRTFSENLGKKFF